MTSPISDRPGAMTPPVTDPNSAPVSDFTNQQLPRPCKWHHKSCASRPTTIGSRVRLENNVMCSGPKAMCLETKNHLVQTKSHVLRDQKSSAPDQTKVMWLERMSVAPDQKSGTFRGLCSSPRPRGASPLGDTQLGRFAVCARRQGLSVSPPLGGTQQGRFAVCARRQGLSAPPHWETRPRDTSASSLVTNGMRTRAYRKSRTHRRVVGKKSFCGKPRYQHLLLLI